MDGFHLGRYQLQSKLAVGGMAEIWLAKQQGPAGFSKQLVIKKILPHLAADASFVEMFLHEGRIAAMINNPHVVQVFELGADGGNYYLVMEHVPGWSLRAIMSRSAQLKRPIPDACVAHLVIGICLGLHAAHELHGPDGKALGLVHRDVSPENVLVTRTGQAKVTDFGIAKATASVSSTQPGMAKGKLAYMPPEQLLGKPLDRRADLYAVGVTLYELLCGERPLKVPADAALSLSVLQERPPLLRVRRPDVPPALEALCASALEKDPAQRPQSAMAMVRELEAFVASVGVAPTAVADHLAGLFPPDAPVAVGGPIAGTARLQGDAPTVQQTVFPRRRLLPWLAGAAVGVLAVAGALALWPRTEPTPVPAPVAAAPPVAPPAPVEPAPVSDLPPSPAPTADVAPPPPAARPPPTVSPPRRPKAGRGRLLVRVNPWGDVLVDGQVAGQTPLKPIDLPAGRHTVTVINSELKKTRTLNVEVKANRQELVEINFQQ